MHFAPALDPGLGADNAPVGSAAHGFGRFGKRHTTILGDAEIRLARILDMLCPERLLEIKSFMEKGRSDYGMQSMDQHLISLCKQGVITVEDAKQITYSTDLERKLMYSS